MANSPDPNPLFQTIADHDHGIFHAERALEIARNEFPPDHPEMAVHRSSLAPLLKATNRPAEAEPLMRDAHRIDRAAYGDDHPVVAIRFTNLRGLLQATHHHSSAKFAKK